jgi:hypothetical protein
MAQEEVVGMMSKLGEAVNGLTHGISQQNMNNCIRKYSGGQKEFRSWIEEIEKYSCINSAHEHNRKAIALQTSEGDVARYLMRRLQEVPQEEWADLKRELAHRYAEITDDKYARAMLKHVKQREGETIQKLSDRILNIASEAYREQDMGNSIIDNYLLDTFIEALRSDALKLKLMREAPRSFQEAVKKALNEENVFRRFELTKRGEINSRHEYHTGEEPMEVEHVRHAVPAENRNRFLNEKGNFRRGAQKNETCMTCRDRGFRPEERKVKQVSETSRIVCYNCQEPGHIARFCRNNRRNDTRTQYRGKQGNFSATH